MASSDDDSQFREEMEALRAHASTLPSSTHNNKQHRTEGSPGPSRGSDDENKTPLPLLLSTSNILVSCNVTTAVKAYAKKQKLRSEQLTQVDAFLALIAAKPAYAASPELKVNIQGYIAPVLLSAKLAAYKGDPPVQHIFNIIKKHRFDTPIGFENNPAETTKIIATIQDALTQGRSQYKKLLFASIKILQNKKAIDLDPEKHQNLFGLAQSFVEGSKCRINAGVCGQIALMRKVFLKYPGSDFYDMLDTRLALMHDMAKGDSEAIDLMFEGLIDDDKEAHSNVDIVYQGVDNIQEEVDDTITASAIDAAITVTLDRDDDAENQDGAVSGGSNQ
ncbi:hypothetical protein C8R43DRAFT_962544 [Mycena crocata]|nr:hypothetical protein C8R43DRAFT_962544 [Mycena crocata]